MPSSVRTSFAQRGLMNAVGASAGALRAGVGVHAGPHVDGLAHTLGDYMPRFWKITSACALPAFPFLDQQLRLLHLFGLHLRRIVGNAFCCRWFS